MADSTPAKKTLKHSTRTVSVLDELTVPDIKFCQHYVEHGNAVEAYRHAGFPKSGSSYQSVGTLAHRLSKSVKIRRYLRHLKAQAADVAKMTAAAVIQSIGWQAFTDRRGVIGQDGEMLPPHLWPAELGAIIAGLDVEELEEWDEDKKCKVKVGNKWKVRFERSGEAKRLLAEWLGLVKNKSDEKDDTATLTDAERLALVARLLGVKPTNDG